MWAVDETMSSICTAIINVGFGAELAWQRLYGSLRKSHDYHQADTKSTVNRWTEEIEELMAWLGWAGEWVGCTKVCAWDEICYIPMWPISWMVEGRGRMDRGGPGFYNGSGPPKFPLEDETHLWEPYCVSNQAWNWVDAYPPAPPCA